MKPAQQFSLARHALVTPAQDRNAPPARLKCTGKLLNDRCLTRPAHGEIADADNKTAERAFAEHSFPIEIKPYLHQAVVDE